MQLRKSVKLSICVMKMNNVICKIIQFFTRFIIVWQSCHAQNNDDGTDKRKINVKLDELRKLRWLCTVTRPPSHDRVTRPLLHDRYYTTVITQPLLRDLRDMTGITRSLSRDRYNTKNMTRAYSYDHHYTAVITRPPSYDHHHTTAISYENYG